MTTPVIVLTFGPTGQPFSLDGLNDNFAALVAAVNALSAEPLLQLGVTPGNLSGYLPITGGSLFGQLSAPSVLIGPVAGPQYNALTVNDLATVGAPGVVKKAVANADAAASAVAVAAVNATDLATVLTLANELKGDVTQLVTDLNAAITRFNALQATLRTAGGLAT